MPQVPMPPPRQQTGQQPEQMPQKPKPTFDQWVTEATDYKPYFARLGDEPQYMQYNQPKPKTFPTLNAPPMQEMNDQVVSQAVQRLQMLKAQKQQNAVGIFQALNAPIKKKKGIK